MRPIVIAALTLVASIAVASPAFAHGGVFRAPPGSVPPDSREPSDPPPPVCVCARVDCTECSHSELRSGSRLVPLEQSTEIVREWPDLRLVRVTTKFRAKESERSIEAYASIAPGKAFGVTGASIAQRATHLDATLRKSEDARRDYLVTRAKRLDPLLLTRRAPGQYDLRAFPVRADGDTVVVVEGLVLSDARFTSRRIYHEGDRYLAVVRVGTRIVSQRPAFVDTRRGCSLYFLSEDEARTAFGRLARSAEAVPGIAALERAVIGDDDRVWVALEANRTRPAETTPSEPTAPAPREPPVTTATPSPAEPVAASPSPR